MCVDMSTKRSKKTVSNHQTKRARGFDTPFYKFARTVSIDHPYWPLSRRRCESYDDRSLSHDALLNWTLEQNAVLTHGFAEKAWGIVEMPTALSQLPHFFCYYLMTSLLSCTSGLVCYHQRRRGTSTRHVVGRWVCVWCCKRLNMQCKTQVKARMNVNCPRSLTGAVTVVMRFCIWQSCDRKVPQPTLSNVSKVK